MTVFAKKGEPVTCENGHIICTFSRNVAVADDFIPTHLYTWTQPEPQRGDSGPVCAQCGALFWHGAGGGQHFHFADGWRDVPPPGRKTIKKSLWERMKKWRRKKKATTENSG